MVHVASSWRSRGDEAKGRWVDAIGRIGLFYPNFVVFIVLGPRGNLVFWLVLAVLKPNRIIRMYTDANCSSFHLRSSSYGLDMTHIESVISLAPNPGRPAKEWGRPVPPWVGWVQAFCHVLSPCHII
jgi:hypothetical protein